MSRSVGALLFWRFMMGITESLYVPAALSIIAALHTGATRSRALSIHASAQFTGIALGGWYGGWTADHIGWRSGFSLLGFVGIAYSAVMFAVFRNLPRSPQLATARQAASPLDILRSRAYLALCAAFFAFTVILWMLYAWLPNFIYEKYGLSLTESGSLATLYLQAGSFAGVLAGGALADRLVKRHPAARFYLVACGFLFSVPLAWLMLAVNSLSAVRLASAAFGLLAGLGIANIFAAAYDVIAPRNYGLGAGALNMLGGISGGAGILAAGFWKASWGVTGLVQISAVVGAILSLVLMASAAVYFDRERSRL
jgi:predicted MFS family arabinose efflux permease